MASPVTTKARVSWSIQLPGADGSDGAEKKAIGDGDQERGDDQFQGRHQLRLDQVEHRLRCS